MNEISSTYRNLGIQLYLLMLYIQMMVENPWKKKPMVWKARHFLCKGAFVILTENIWKSAGIYNGETGRVVGIIVSNGQPTPGSPEYSVFNFGESYTCPHLLGNGDNGIRG